MFSNKLLYDYATLVLKKGVNLQNGQGLEILCPVNCKKVAEIFTERAYELGASIVSVRWSDDVIDKLKLINSPSEILTDIPKWFVESKEYLVKKGFCYIAIDADDPSAFEKVPPEKMGAYATAKGKALKKFSESVMANGIRWCVVSVPSLAWAKKVFPKEKRATEKLAEQIIKAMRLDTPDPVKAWEQHIDDMERRAKYLNKMNFEYLNYKNSLGTDLRIGLCDDHVWLSAMEKAKDGINFVANMPTEEVFTAPHRLKADGILKSALPLSDNGQIIDGFTLEFKDGKIVGYDAKKGLTALKRLIQTDGGTKRLGEVALIGKNSPISKSGILFYNTLFDENASCHLAIGKGYPTTVKDGSNMTLKQLKEKGLNDSVDHVDFMIGTADLNIKGEKDGKFIQIFNDGEWCI